MYHLLYSFITCCKILPSKGLWSQLRLLAASLLQMPKGLMGGVRWKKKRLRGTLSAVFSELIWRTKRSLPLQFKSPQSKSQQLLSQHSPCCNCLSVTADLSFWAGPVGKGHSKFVFPARKDLHVKMVHFPKLTVATVCLSEARTDIKQQRPSVEQGHSCRKLSVLCYRNWKWCSSKLCSFTEYELNLFWPTYQIKTIFACEVYCWAAW